VSNDIIIIFVAIVATSFLSGLFSLGGGTILMGVFVWILPVTVAMLLHGVTQFASNGSRAVVYWKYIHWPIIGGYLVGAVIVTALFSLVAFVPSKVVVFLLVGALPFANYVMPKGYALDVTRRGGSLTCGAVNTSAMLLSGVSGPILDVFFVKTDLTRYQTMATKGLIQTFAHILKMIYYGGIIVFMPEFDAVLPWWVYAGAIVLSVLSNLAASRFHGKMTDVQFRAWTQRLTIAIGATFLIRGVLLWVEGG